MKPVSLLGGLTAIFLLSSCHSTRLIPSEGNQKRGPEISKQELKRVETPLEAGIEILAMDVRVLLSRNYRNDPTLLLPGGAGNIHKMSRRPFGNQWVADINRELIPMVFKLRDLKLHAIRRLVVDFPPTDKFTCDFACHGRVFIDFKDGRKIRGEVLRIRNGRLVLDGKDIAIILGGSE